MTQSKLYRVYILCCILVFMSEDPTHDQGEIQRSGSLRFGLDCPGSGAGELCVATSAFARSRHSVVATATVVQDVGGGSLYRRVSAELFRSVTERVLLGLSRLIFTATGEL